MHILTNLQLNLRSKNSRLFFKRELLLLIVEEPGPRNGEMPEFPMMT